MEHAAAGRWRTTSAPEKWRCLAHQLLQVGECHAAEKGMHDAADWPSWDVLLLQDA